MTQEQIQKRLSAQKPAYWADKTGLDIASISRWSNGSRAMSKNVIFMWACFFELEQVKADKITLIEVLGIKA
jgi:hypothetical protein